jgi:putative DNA primase/helicase
MNTTTLRPIDHILDELKYDGPRESGRQCKCTCPAHDDSTESLSVTEAKDGKVLIKCFAGCTTESILEQVGLKMTDLFPSQMQSTNAKSKSLGPIVGTYDYVDTDGKVVHQTLRYEPPGRAKTFLQRRPDGNGGWIWKDVFKGITPVLYRLPELLAAANDQWVFVVEGEKDVENLRAIGLTATCNVMGAGKWRSHYAQWLTGRNVIVLEDNDKPGRDHAADVANQLLGKAATVRVLKLPDLPLKGDVSDWLAAGGTADKLLALVEATPDYIAPIPEQAETYTNGKGEHAKPTESSNIMADLAALGYAFVLNQLDDVIEVNGERLDDGLAAKIRTQMRDLGYKNMSALEDAYMAAAYENRYHPVRRYLDSLVWDGQDHFRRLCSHIKDKHDPIVYRNKDGEVVSKTPVFTVWLYRWMLAAVAKTYEKKVQGPVLVWDGNQGLGKSRLAAFLGCVLPDMFLESPIHPDDKEHDRYLATRWIWEIAELGATTRRADREALKAFVTKNDVTFRKPYGRHPITKPALANFIGTINNEAGFLTDPTGERRFLVVTIESIDWGYEMSVDANQLWAQIVADYKQGERWELLPVEQKARDGMNSGYQRGDPIEDRIVHSFDIDKSKTDWFMFTSEILDHLRTMGAKDSDQALYNGIGTAMRRLKIPTAQKTVGGQRGRGYYGIRKQELLHTMHSPAQPQNG